MTRRSSRSFARDVGAWSVIDTSGPHLRFEIRANAFCHQMVRSIVGTLVDVGLGRTPPGAVPAISPRDATRPAGSPRRTASRSGRSATSHSRNWAASDSFLHLGGPQLENPGVGRPDCSMMRSPPSSINGRGPAASGGWTAACRRQVRCRRGWLASCTAPAGPRVERARRALWTSAIDTDFRSPAGAAAADRTVVAPAGLVGVAADRHLLATHDGVAHRRDDRVDRGGGDADDRRCSAMRIGPMSRPLSPLSLAIAPTRSAGRTPPLRPIATWTNAGSPPPVGGREPRRAPSRSASSRRGRSGRSVKSGISVSSIVAPLGLVRELDRRQRDRRACRARRRAR